MLGKPHRRLETSPPIVKGDQAAWELAVCDDGFEFGLWEIVWKEEHRAERTSLVAAHEQVDVTDMVRHQNHSRSRRVLVEPFPQTDVVKSRSERVQHQPLTT
jgi:hypothetical protein